MEQLFPLYVSLDLLSAVLTLAVVGFFFLTWRRTGNALHLLLAFAFFLIAASFVTVTTSQFALVGPRNIVDALRLAGQTGGALVLASAYLSLHQHGRARPWLAVGWAVGAGVLIVAAVYLFVPPFAELPTPAESFTIGHLVQFAAYCVCVGFASASFRRTPRLDNLLVPAGFLLFALSKYTWLLIDVSRASVLVPFVFVWRFGALVLLLLALLLPTSPSRKEANGRA